MMESGILRILRNLGVRCRSGAGSTLRGVALGVLAGGLVGLCPVESLAQSVGTSSGDTSIRALLAPRNRSTLSSLVSGRIIEMPVRAGDRFAAKDLLFRLDCRMLDAQRRITAAELKGHKRQLSFQKRLYKRKAGSPRDLARAETAVDRASAELSRHVLMVRLCGTRAPFPGRVVERKAQPFEYVRAGQEVLDVIDERSFEISMIVPSFWLSWLKIDTPFELQIDETKVVLDGRIDRIGANIDPASQSLRITGRLLAPPEGLVAGMSGTATFFPPASQPSTEVAPRTSSRTSVSARARAARPTWTVDLGVARPRWSVDTRGRR